MEIYYYAALTQAGATRNFEALRKAEEIAEKEQEARKEELENNPMKLLEERTTQSKNEMEIAESLDELRELNRRTVALDYDSMFEKFAEEKRNAELAEEQRDEEFVKSIFSKDDAGDKIKRLHDDSDEEQEEGTVKKVSRLENATDHLVEKRSTAEKAVWERSIGTLSNKKAGLGVLVKKKVLTTLEAPKHSKTENEISTKVIPRLGSVSSKPSLSSGSGSNALGLLGNYSGSESE